MSNEYSVYWWDLEGNQNEELRFVSLSDASLAVRRLTKGPAAALGVVTRCIATDGGDCTIFEWTYADSVIHPQQQDPI